MKDLSQLAEKHFQKDLEHCTDNELLQVAMTLVDERLQAMPLNQGKKKLYYLSAEFLMGKLLTTNLINLGLYDEVKKELEEHGKSLNDLELAEQEPSLGNGGLGRLAACFLDSIANLGLNGDGVGLNYHFGLFRQFFWEKQQNARPDKWLDQPNFLHKEDRSYEISFKDFTFKSTLYSLDIPGYKKSKRNRLRLFDLDLVDESIVEKDSIRFDANRVQDALTLFLYPDDSEHSGRLLRIYQQYFMVSNAAQLLIDEALEKGSNLHDLADYALVQINDTHPAFVIPELIRLLTTVHGMEFEEAVSITSQMVAFTNHTILAEALEKWPMEDVEDVIPEIAAILRRLDESVRASYPGKESVYLIDKENRVHMAHLAIHFGFSVNGVAKLHTDILKESELKDFYEIYPDKFNNKTNGITFRRWLMACNPDLCHLLDQEIGDEWRQTEDLTALLAKKDQDDVLSALKVIKDKNKEKLAGFLAEHQDTHLLDGAIVDVQIKRIHEYKRQQMLALYIIHKYLAIKAGDKPETPITIIFGGKAAPAYILAQDIIHLILCLSELIKNDPEVSPYLQVVMVENYNVTAAEYLIPAADISEQISLASKEASGTGNMKFMLNGALTVCTMDGANVEIAELVGKENVYVFGQSSESIVELYEKASYNPQDYYKLPQIKRLVDFIVGPELVKIGKQERLERLYKDITTKDWFMALIDLEDFIAIKEKAYADYENQQEWMEKVLINIAKAGYFSSDRTIKEYNDDIWHLPRD
ncbi:glycogen/starch/alpha-glucan family phosphorylase [Atopobacter sp. AH10]|uniref:glycogen/starch/alpha-glucan family phosphorylase n=1 Tax=Atopobacter sp. AH10 TaxID=2315861 RepID=UPI000EF17869|nr:glycogen/starch/alpha-glucan phosphorylase [Atopobacter sp. AH10]RLK64211.1 glycogen/starch/alpha-glucan family phosphorylase [Atopobacter sp. AH10]